MNTSASPSEPDSAIPAVLVHGLWMGGWMLMPLRLHLRAAGIDAHVFSYPSTDAPLAENARRLADFARGLGAARLHFVGHSLGGMIVWRALLDHADLPPGRAVFLGSPLLGSHAARRFARYAVGNYMLGRSLERLTQGEEVPARAPRETGIIAGNLGIGLGRLVAPDLETPHDGVVAVSETRLPCACDHLVLPLAHTTLAFAASAARQTAHFLRHGGFDRALVPSYGG